MGRMILNAITVIALVVCILTGCMLDSESMIPAYICGISTLTLMASSWLREKC